MKWYVPLAAALLLLVMSGSASALLLLDWEQGRIGASGVTMKLVEEDDPADDSRPATPEYLILELSNQKRRYVGVAIIQVAPSSNEDPIMDNGDDDTYIVPASELISLSSALNVVGYDPWPSSRRYILPIKRQGGTIPPGVEYRFQGQIVGPGFGVRQDVEHLSNMTPWSLPTSDLWYGATGRTLLMVYGLPTLNMLSPGVSAKLQQISENQWVAWEIGIGLEKLCKELGPQIQDCLQRQDSKCLIDLGIETFDLLFLKTEAGKRVMEQWFKEHQIRTLTRHLDTLKDYLLTPATAAQLFNDLLLEPSSLTPLQTFEVVVTRPQVTDVNPPMQDPGGIVTIHGKGFDPFSPLSKTTVQFTGQKEVNNIPSLRFDAQVIDIPDEETIKVLVPEEAVQGPIQVCDKQLTDTLGPDFACSNTDVEYGAIQLAGIEAELTNEEGFEIEPGGPLLRVASFEGRVTNLTPDFVPTDWIVRLYVNGSPAKEKNLTDKADFKFWLDKDTFDPGSYRVHAEVNVAGRLLKTENFSFRVGDSEEEGLSFEERVFSGSFSQSDLEKISKYPIGHYDAGARREDLLPIPPGTYYKFLPPNTTLTISQDGKSAQFSTFKVKIEQAIIYNEGLRDEVVYPFEKVGVRRNIKVECLTGKRSTNGFRGRCKVYYRRHEWNHVSVNVTPKKEKKLDEIARWEAVEKKDRDGKKYYVLKINWDFFRTAHWDQWGLVSMDLILKHR